LLLTVPFPPRPLWMATSAPRKLVFSSFPSSSGASFFRWRLFIFFPPITGYPSRPVFCITFFFTSLTNKWNRVSSTRPCWPFLSSTTVFPSNHSSFFSTLFPRFRPGTFPSANRNQNLAETSLDFCVCARPFTTFFFTPSSEVSDSRLLFNGATGDLGTHPRASPLPLPRFCT